MVSCVDNSTTFKTVSKNHLYQNARKLASGKLRKTRLSLKSAMKLASTLLLLLYISAVCRPALPLVADGLAHLFWHKHHLQTKHAQKGQNHLVKEIAAETELECQIHKGVPASNKTTDKSSDFLFAHLIADVPHQSFLPKKCLTALGECHLLPMGNCFTEVLTPPPDLLS